MKSESEMEYEQGRFGLVVGAQGVRRLELPNQQPGEVMKISVPKCPKCGEPPEGTVDDVPGIALFGEIDESGRTEWGGETRVCWDGQMSRTNDAGEVLVQCSEAHEWYTAIDYERERR